MKTITPAAKRAAIRIERGQARPAEKSTHVLSYPRFVGLLEKITNGMKEMAFETHESRPDGQFAAVVSNRGNDMTLHLYGADFRVSIEMAEAGVKREGVVL